jgi:hypothetical protein
LDCGIIFKIIFKTLPIRILIDLSLAHLTWHYASSIMRLGGYVRYRTFSTGIFYALCITTIDYLSTTYYSIVACMHLAWFYRYLRTRAGTTGYYVVPV